MRGNRIGTAVHRKRNRCHPKLGVILRNINVAQEDYTYIHWSVMLLQCVFKKYKNHVKRLSATGSQYTQILKPKARRLSSLFKMNIKIYLGYYQSMMTMMVIITIWRQSPAKDTFQCLVSNETYADKEANAFRYSHRILFSGVNEVIKNPKSEDPIHRSYWRDTEEKKN